MNTVSFLSIDHQELLQKATAFPIGINCVRAKGENVYRIILKITIDFAITLKNNREFKIYVVPISLEKKSLLGLMCAFFDDKDEPLVIWRPLDSGSDSEDLLYSIQTKNVIVHVFDEKNREILGYQAVINIPLMAKIRIEHHNLTEIDNTEIYAAEKQARNWFGQRTKNDDLDAITVCLEKPTLHEDMFISYINATDQKITVSHTELDRKEPGYRQESDIINLLSRIFNPGDLYHSPKRHYDKEEIADIIVVTKNTCLIIQAKDSPNTTESISRTLDRKRRTSIRLAKDAIKQLSGSLGYIRRSQGEPLRMILGSQEVSIDINGKSLLCLAVVRELFNNDSKHYFDEISKFWKKENTPCLIFDYAELHMYTSFCRSEDSFIKLCKQVHKKIVDEKAFSRMRFYTHDIPT